MASIFSFVENQAKLALPFPLKPLSSLVAVRLPMITQEIPELSRDTQDCAITIYLDGRGGQVRPPQLMLD
jgi:hypothetical protein